MQESNCFGEIRLLPRKYFNMLSCMIRSKRTETGRQFLKFCLSPFLKIGTMFPFFQSSGDIPHFKQFLNILKRGGYFQHANTDHIMTMSFTRVESIDGSFNIILHELNVSQVPIRNGIS